MVYSLKTMVHRSFLIAATLGYLLVPNGIVFGAAPIDFQGDVAPIFVRRCLNCHNDGDRRGGLSLQSADAVGQGGDSGQVLAPGDTASSYLLELLIPTDGTAEMPKDERPLASHEIDAIRRWIADGAVWPSEVVLEPPMLWSLKPLVRPAIPTGIIATDHFPIRNPIDAFVAAKHREAGLEPSFQADRRTLIRRLYLDITGLLPSPAAVDSFVADSKPKAYQRLVDELLQSPHFGEQWGRHWLDLARMPTATAISATTCVRGLGSIAIGSSTRSIGINRSISFRSSSWPAIFCRKPHKARRSQPGFIETI